MCYKTALWEHEAAAGLAGNKSVSAVAGLWQPSRVYQLNHLTITRPEDRALVVASAVEVKEQHKV